MCATTPATSTREGTQRPAERTTDSGHGTMGSRGTHTPSAPTSSCLENVLLAAQAESLLLREMLQIVRISAFYKTGGKNWRQKNNFISARFTCHAFAFRYPGASSIIGSGSTNCEMSDRDLRTVTSVARCLIYHICRLG